LASGAGCPGRSRTLPPRWPSAAEALHTARQTGIAPTVVGAMPVWPLMSRRFTPRVFPPRAIAGYSGLRSNLNADPLSLLVCRADSRSRAFTPVRDPL
jgi:hypothetical protein